jgi:hypothetical protein
MKLETGQWYYCRECRLVYQRGNSRHPWAACGHPAARQRKATAVEQALMLAERHRLALDKTVDSKGVQAVAEA